MTIGAVIVLTGAILVVGLFGIYVGLHGKDDKQHNIKNSSKHK